MKEFKGDMYYVYIDRYWLKKPIFRMIQYLGLKLL